MRTLSMSIDHKRIFCMFLLLILSLSLAVFVFNFLTQYLFIVYIDPDKYTYYVISLMAVNGSTTMCLLTFILILYCFYARFDLINACLKENFRTQEEDVRRVSKGGKALAATVMKLADLHDSLVDASVKMNHCFSFQMVTVVAGTFCNNIFSTFAIYRVFVQNDYQNFYKASIQYAWNIYFLFYGFAIIALSSLMTRTGKYTAVMVHKAINFIDNDDDPIIDTVRLIKLLTQNELVELILFHFTM